MSEIGKRLVAAMQEAVDHSRGDRNLRTTSVPVSDVNIKAIRKSQGMTQQDFADTYGFALSALRNWEQGRRVPDRSARLLLLLIEREPELVKGVVHELTLSEIPA